MGGYQLPFLVHRGDFLPALGYRLQHLVSEICRLAYFLDVVVELLVAYHQRDAAISVPYLTKDRVDGDCHIVVGLLLLDINHVAVDVLGSKPYQVGETQPRPASHQEEVTNLGKVWMPGKVADPYALQLLLVERDGLGVLSDVLESMPSCVVCQLTFHGLTKKSLQRYDLMGDGVGGEVEALEVRHEGLKECLVKIPEVELPAQFLLEPLDVLQRPCVLPFSLVGDDLPSSPSVLPGVALGNVSVKELMERHRPRPSSSEVPVEHVLQPLLADGYALPCRISDEGLHLRGYGDQRGIDIIGIGAVFRVLNTLPLLIPKQGSDLQGRGVHKFLVPSEPGGDINGGQGVGVLATKNEFDVCHSVGIWKAAGTQGNARDGS